MCINVIHVRTKSYHVLLKRTSLSLEKKGKKNYKKQELFYILYEYLVFTSLYVTT